MKSKFAFCVIVFFHICLSAVHVQASIVRSGGVALGGPSGPNMDQYVLQLWQDSGFTDFTSVFMDLDSVGQFGTDYALTGTNYSLDEGSSWFFVRAGDVLTPQKVAAGDFDLILGHRNATGGQIDLNSVTFSPISDVVFGLEEGPDDFYLGVSGVSYDTSHADVQRDVFGWVKLRVVPSLTGLNELVHLELIESVVSYNSPGIIIGTTTIVPEPSSMALLCIAVLVMTKPKRRRMESVPFLAQ